MKKKEIMNLHERSIVVIQDGILELENLFPLNHPVRQALCESRISLNRAIKTNRLKPTSPQDSWVYLVESEVQL